MISLNILADTSHVFILSGWNVSLLPHYIKLLSAVLEVGLGEEGCHNAILHKNQLHLILDVALGYAKNLSPRPIYTITNGWLWHTAINKTKHRSFVLSANSFISFRILFYSFKVNFSPCCSSHVTTLVYLKVIICMALFIPSAASYYCLFFLCCIECHSFFGSDFEIMNGMVLKRKTLTIG